MRLKNVPYRSLNATHKLVYTPIISIITATGTAGFTFINIIMKPRIIMHSRN